MGVSFCPGWAIGLLLGTADLEISSNTVFLSFDLIQILFSSTCRKYQVISGELSRLGFLPRLSNSDATPHAVPVEIQNDSE